MSRADLGGPSRRDVTVPPFDPAVVSAAIVAYVGVGRTKFPTADAGAVRDLETDDADALLDEVRRVLGESDRIAFSDVEPFDDGLRERLQDRLRTLLPTLGGSAVEALGWRWGFLNLR